MIDPVEFGEMKGRVAAMEAAILDIRTQQKLADQKLDMVLDKLSEAKGGWRVLMLLGGAAATLGGAITWVTQNVHLKP